MPSSITDNLTLRISNSRVLFTLLILLSLVSISSPPSATAMVKACTLNWTAEIQVTDDGSKSEVLTIGQGTATDGIDSDCGEARLPPKPPTGAFDARLILPGGIDASKKDFRSSVETGIEWRIEFQPGSGGYPLEFSWNPANLPSGTWILRDLFSAVVNINMKSQNSYTLSNDNIDTLVVEFEASNPLRQLYLPLVVSG